MTSTWVEKTSSLYVGGEVRSLYIHIATRACTHTHRLLWRVVYGLLTCPLPALVAPPLLDSRARPCQRWPPHCSVALPLILGSEPGLSASPGHSFPLLAFSGPRVLGFQFSMTAISPPQGPTVFPGPGARLTRRPWSRRRPLDQFALLRSDLLH